MDITSIIGIIFAFASLLIGYVEEGGAIPALWMPSAAIIVIGGSLGCMMLSYSVQQVLQLPKLFLEVFIAPKSTVKQKIDYLVKLSEAARKEGLLSLEKMLENDSRQTDPFLRRGVMMVIDGVDPEEINEMLQNEIDVYEENKRISISMLDAVAGYTPAFGMIGTITGLVMVLQDMQSPEQMTSAIGVAFLATLYGVVAANMIFIPAASKLKSRLSLYRLEKEMIIEGVLAIRNGINPRLLEEKLSPYLILSSKGQKKA